MLLVASQALVGNLPYSVHENDIGDYFQQCDVTDIFLVKDRETGDLKVSNQRTFILWLLPSAKLGGAATLLYGMSEKAVDGRNFNIFLLMGSIDGAGTR